MPEDNARDIDIDLSVGDYVYQSDQELFLVVTDVREDSYKFAVHGWREIADYRLDEYLEGDQGQLYKHEEVKSEIEQRDDPDVSRKFKKLTELFSVYRDGLSDDGPHTKFTLDDTSENDS